MKTIASELAYFLRGKARKNLKFLAGYSVFVTSMIVVYAWVFDYLMLRLEGRHFSFISGIYWAITAMTTLGYGDITFESDGGRAFSALVTVSGVVFLLILMPFIMISLFLAPWLEDRLRYQPPTEVGKTVSGHVILVGWDSVTRTLVDALRPRGTGYVVVTSDYNRTARLDGRGISVALGVPTDEDVLERVGACRAKAVVANMEDTDNANLILSVHALCPQTPVIAILSDPEKGELLRLAGAERVLPLRQLLGRNLAVRSTTRGAFAHVVDSIDNLLIAEMPVLGTPFVNKTLSESGIRERTGLSVIATWERGRTSPVTADTYINPGTVLILVGSREQLQNLERLSGEDPEEDEVLILGYGTVGKAAAEFLRHNGVRHRVVDREPAAQSPSDDVIVGSAEEAHVLETAGVKQARGIIVTTNDDGTNVYLTLAARHLNPDARIVSRSNREENVDSLYAAGADFVVSMASVGANVLLNALEGKETVFLSEGLTVYRRSLPDTLSERRLSDLAVRRRTGATVVAVQVDERELVSPTPDTLLMPGMRLVMVGSPESEGRFIALVEQR